MPILVDGAGLRVLIVGGGAVATRKFAAFLHAGARVRLVAPQLSDDLRPFVESEQIEWRNGRYEPSDLADAQLVIAATGDRETNARVAADARAAHRLVNVADEPDDGTFTMMAVHRSGPLVVGVSAGGVPGAAVRIRDAIARRFDGRYSRALERLAELRHDALAHGERARWRAFAHQVVDVDFCRAVEDATLEEKVTSWR